VSRPAPPALVTGARAVGGRAFDFLRLRRGSARVPAAGSRPRGACSAPRASPRPEGWPSGLRRTLGKRVYGKPYRGFESHSLRQLQLSKNSLSGDVVLEIPRNGAVRESRLFTVRCDSRARRVLSPAPFSAAVQWMRLVDRFRMSQPQGLSVAAAVRCLEEQDACQLHSGECVRQRASPAVPDCRSVR
jgi:hypothetical protein